MDDRHRKLGTLCANKLILILCLNFEVDIFVDIINWNTFTGKMPIIICYDVI